LSSPIQNDDKSDLVDSIDDEKLNQSIEEDEQKQTILNLQRQLNEANRKVFEMEDKYNELVAMVFNDLFDFAAQVKRYRLKSKQVL